MGWDEAGFTLTIPTAQAAAARLVLLRVVEALAEIASRPLTPRARIVEATEERVGEAPCIGCEAIC